MKKVAIMVSESGLLALLHKVIDGFSYNVCFYSQESATVQTISVDAPDLIFMEWCEPCLEVPDLLREMIGIPKFYSIPIVLLAKRSLSHADLKFALKGGAAGVVCNAEDASSFEMQLFAFLHMADKFVDSKIAHQQHAMEDLEEASTKIARLEEDVYRNEKELLFSALGIFHNVKFISQIKNEIAADSSLLNGQGRLAVIQLLDKYEKISKSFNWESFERSFTGLSAAFYCKLSDRYPSLSFSEQRLCGLFKIGLSMKEIAILNYSSYMAVRKAVYRMRKKLQLAEHIELNSYFRQF